MSTRRVRRSGTRMLATGAVSALNTLNAWRPLSRRGPLSMAAFAAGWFPSELPLQCLATEALVTASTARSSGARTRASRAGLLLHGMSGVGLLALHAQAAGSGAVLEQALREGLGTGYREHARRGVEHDGRGPTGRALLLPGRGARKRLLAASDVAYGPAGVRNQLDVWRRPDLPADGRAPVIVQVHGGAWMTGRKEDQALPLLSELVDHGWVGVAVNYRLSPRATWPEHIVDVKRSIAWVRREIAAYGGDPAFIAITGGSAGGHLSSLAALSPNDPAYQPGFEHEDTTVQAAVPFYGVYQMDNRNGRGRDDTVEFLAERVFKTSPETDRESWDRASPTNRVGPHAPPFFVVHGTNDSLALVEQARWFVDRLRAESSRPVVYAELPRAQHAFELLGSVRTFHTVRAVERFLTFVHQHHAPDPVHASR